MTTTTIQRSQQLVFFFETNKLKTENDKRRMLLYKGYQNEVDTNRTQTQKMTRYFTEQIIPHFHLSLQEKIQPSQTLANSQYILKRYSSNFPKPEYQEILQ